MFNFSPAFVGFARAIGTVCLVAVLTYLGDASHLTGLVNLSVATLISAVAMAIEQHITPTTGALFGIVRPK